MGTGALPRYRVCPRVSVRMWSGRDQAAACLAYIAVLMHALSQWISAGVVVLLGLGIVGAVTHTRRRDPPE